ncbi:MAG TPA: hypothetical protein VFI68_11440, partial [Anaerolineales bacterium]|nr:hypothetical protein [Anaerolineales bacterium]
MSSIFLLIGGTAITLGVIFSYIIAIRAVQESRRSPNYITRQQNTVRARRAYSSLGVFIAAGFLLLIFNLLPGKSLPSIPPLNTPTPLASSEFTQSPAPVNTPENNPTAFILTATPEVPPTPTRTPSPSIPLAVEALFKGDVTPQSDVAINDLKFSTHIENGLPVVITT